MTSRSEILRAGAVVAASLALGGLTSYAQGWLPGALSSLANSASGWTALTVLVVGLARPRPVLGALLGAASFVCLVLGYTAVSQLRGLAYDPLLWSVVGLLGGPFVGAAAAALPSRDPRAAALGSGLVAGVLVADGIYGLTVVASSTSPVYWSLAILTGVLLLGVVATTRLRGVRPVLLQVGTTVATVAAASAAFAVLNAVIA